VGEAQSTGVTQILKGFIRIFVKPNPNTPRLDVATDNVSVRHTGTVYDVGYDDVALRRARSASTKARSRSRRRTAPSRRSRSRPGTESRSGLPASGR